MGYILFRVALISFLLFVFSGPILRYITRDSSSDVTIPITDQRISDALYVAAEITGRKITEAPPTVTLVYSKLRYVALSCPFEIFTCSSLATYSSRTKAVTVDANNFDKMDKVSQEGVLVHEMVHHLQGFVQYNRWTCPRIEREAYEAQQTYLSIRGLSLSKESIDRSIKTTCEKLPD